MTLTTSEAQIPPDFDRRKELKAFDDSKAGVKGLVDAGLTRIPCIFIHERSKIHDKPCSGTSRFDVPIVDLAGLAGSPSAREEVIRRVRRASEKWGFFQVVNHGVPEEVMEEMIEGVRRFNEQDSEVKKKFYTRDTTRGFMHVSNFNLYQSPAADWRDTIGCELAPHPPEPQELPHVCRYVLG